MRLWHSSNKGWATGESCPDCGAEVIENENFSQLFFCSRKEFGCEWFLDEETIEETCRARELIT